jgi:HK97 family phage major capsid protein
MSEMTPEKQKMTDNINQIPEISKTIEVLAKNMEAQKTVDEKLKANEEKIEAITKAHEEKLEAITKAHASVVEELDELKKSQRQSGQMGGSSANILDKQEVKDCIEKALQTTHSDIPVEIYKSLVSYDNTRVGALLKPSEIAGIIDINALSTNKLSTMVRNYTTNAIDAVTYSTIDRSVKPTGTTLEAMQPAERTDFMARNTIKIMPKMYSESGFASIKVVDGIRQGNYIENPIAAEFAAIDDAMTRSIDNDILIGPIASDGVNGIFTTAQTEGSKIKKFATATTNVVKMIDLVLLVSKLKKQYLINPILIIDRVAYNALYSEQADDGHIRDEYFDYSNGWAALKSPERIIPIIPIDSFDNTVPLHEHNGFAGYTSFTNPNVTIDAGYQTGNSASNSGKAYAVIMDANAYVLTRNSVKKTFLVDSGIADERGMASFGIRDYIGGKVVIQEAIAIGYIA